jgi:hypothetical protein
MRFELNGPWLANYRWPPNSSRVMVRTGCNTEPKHAGYVVPIVAMRKRLRLGSARHPVSPNVVYSLPQSPRDEARSAWSSVRAATR